MKKHLLFLLFATAISVMGQWVTQNSGLTTNLFGVHFEDANLGFAVGANGKIIKTTDGGTTWIAQTSGIATQLNSVCFVNSTTGWAVGAAGKILKTTDGGSTWAAQPSGIAQELFSVSFVSSTIGWVSGDLGKIIKTTDGGSSWSTQATGTTDVFWGISMVDTQNGFAVGGSHAAMTQSIRKTINGGTNWTAIFPAINTPAAAVSMADAQHGFISGSWGLIEATSDGTNWITYGGGAEWFYAVHCVDANTAWIGGGSGTIKKTTDAGVNWTAQATGIANAIRGIFFVNANLGWAVADGGKILKYSSKNITVIAPNGGENWEVGTNQNITWTSNGVANVKIEYSTNNGTSWSTIIASTPAAPGTFNWPIPNTPTTLGLVKISDVADATTNDISNAVFTIPLPAITVTSPNGGERWLIGSQHDITWNSASVVNVKIEYSTDMGSSWNTIINSTAAINRTYPWTIPNTPTVYGLVRITDVSDGTVSDQSNSIFSIPNVTLTAPNGGEILYVGSNYTIGWTSVGVTNVLLRYRTGNMPSGSWTTIGTASANLGSYNWLVPNDVSNSCLVSIIGDYNQAITDQSDANFAIQQPIISLTVPNGGEKWLTGTDQNITWTSRGLTSVKLEYTTDNGVTWNLIINNIGGEGSYFYNWPLPNTTSRNFKVRVSSVSNPSISDLSDNAFSILPMILTSPVGGENWKGATRHDITWQSNNISRVTIQYSTDGGAAWQNINSAINISANPGTFNWSVPNITTSNALIKVIDAANSSVSDQNETPFSIYSPSILVNSPNGGEVWQSGSIQNIRWTSTFVENVKIEYSIDRGGWTEIISSTPANAGNYFWNIPPIASTLVLIKVTDVSDANIYGRSANYFTIAGPGIEVTSPNGGEKWRVGTAHNITWNSRFIANVQIEYSIDNGLNWKLINTPVNASLGFFNWIIPDDITTQALIRISDASNVLVNDASNSVFEIYSSAINVLYPNGGEILARAKTNTITWNSENVGFVKIEYYYPYNLTWYEIVSGVDASLGRYDWQLPEALEMQGSKIRITSLNNPLIYDESDGFFGTRLLKIISPNGGERWQWFTSQNVQWYDSDKNITGKLLEYSSDNGVTWNFISAYQGEPNFIYQQSNKSTNWIPGGQPSNLYKVRVTDRFHANLTDESDGTFEIFTQPIIVSHPNGGEEFLAKDKIYISFIVQEAIKKVNILYTTDNGVNWNEIISNYDVSTPTAYNIKQYEWHAPRSYSQNFKILVVDIENGLNNDLSDNPFRISRRPIDIIYPTGSEIYSPGESYSTGGTTQIRTNTIYVKAKVSDRDRRVNWYSIPNFCEWPNEIAGGEVDENGEVNFTLSIGNCRQGYMTASIWRGNTPGAGEHDDVSVLVKPHPFQIISPTFRELIPAEKAYRIKWNLVDPEVENVKIELFTNQGTIVIAENYPAATGEFIWQVPKSLIGVSDASLRLSDATMPTYYRTAYELDIVFRREIIVETPTEAEALTSGSTKQIKWTSLNVQRVKIEYGLFLNGGNEIATINSSTSPNYSGSVNWIIPDVRSGYYVVIITDIDNPTTSAHKNIYIKNPKVTLHNIQSPLIVGDRISISWETDLTEHVKVKYSVDAGASWFTIGTFDNYKLSGQVQNFGGCEWIVPEQITNQLIIRVEDINDPSIGSQSEHLIISYPVLRFKSPASGTRFNAGDFTLIEWEEYGYHYDEGDSFKIEYSLDNGSTWHYFDSERWFARSIPWVIPGLYKETKYLFRITISVPNLTYRNNQLEIIVNPIPRRVISSTGWNNPLNFAEGSSPVSIISDLIIGPRAGTNIKKAIIRIHADEEPDSIKQRFRLTCTSSLVVTKTWENDGLILILSYLPGGADVSANLIQSVMFQYIGDPYKIDGIPYSYISLVLIDEDSSNVLTRPLTFTSVNSVPVISDNSSINFKYTLGAPPVSLIQNLSINDDVNLHSIGKLELRVVENGVSEEDLFGCGSSSSIQSTFFQSQGKFQLIETITAPNELLRLAKEGIYYLVQSGIKSLNKNKKIEIQYFDDYHAGSNFLTKYVFIEAPRNINSKLSSPGDLKIEYVTGGNIRVTWKDTNGQPKGFIIYRSRFITGRTASVNSAEDDIVGVIPAGQFSFIDSTAIEGNNYNYRVAAYDETGVSDLAAQPPIVANIMIKPPTNLAYKVISSSSIKLTWEDNSQIEEGFIIEICEDNSNNFKTCARINRNISEYDVKNLLVDKMYRFRISAYQNTLVSEVSNVLKVKLTTTDLEELGLIPNEFALYQNHPNPFNPTTTISYNLPMNVRVRVTIYNVLGEAVEKLVNEIQTAGYYSKIWDGKALSSGIYLLKVEAESLESGERYVKSMKMLMVK